MHLCQKQTSLLLVFLHKGDQQRRGCPAPGVGDFVRAEFEKLNLQPGSGSRLLKKDFLLVN